MEKKGIRLTWQDVIKYGLILLAAGSAYGSLIYKDSEQDRRIENLEIENKELRKVAEKVAEINGKQDIIIKYVEAINSRLDSDADHN